MFSWRLKRNQFSIGYCRHLKFYYWAWWGPEIPAPLGYEVEGFKFETSLGYIAIGNGLGVEKGYGCCSVIEYM
jgi:hypothetical protein